MSQNANTSERKSKICLCLTGKTIKEDLALVEKYRPYIDLVELRADYLDDDEKLSIKHFPYLAGIPSILTIRRKVDGGMFTDSEASRTTLFAMVLAYSEQNLAKNFAYIDMESDYFISSLNDAVIAFNTKIIRSYHDFSGPVSDLGSMMKSLRKTGFEIPKVAFMPHSLSDVTHLYEQSNKITDYEHIVLAMGPIGQVSRILSDKFNSYLTYTCPESSNSNLSEIGQIDPITLNNLYHFRSINKDTQIYGVTGWPLKVTSSPALHNAGYEKYNLNAVYVPVRSDDISQVIDFAEKADIKGLSVTVPHKNNVLKYLSQKDDIVKKVGASNTITQFAPQKWAGYNTDVEGFRHSLLEFLADDSSLLKSRLSRTLKGKKVAIIGAGGAAKAVAYVVNELKGNACVFNRTFLSAKMLADEYGFKYALLWPESVKLLQKYSDLIIQTTSVGLGVGENESSTAQNDPLYFYPFSGHEKVYDVIYEPQKTPVLVRAQRAGCEICNGENMLKYQGYEQFKIYTGKEFG